MTNQEAIEILKRLQESEDWDPQITSEAYEALGHTTLMDTFDNYLNKGPRKLSGNASIG